MKLSVIIPIYNAERYLSRCLDSLLRQEMPEGEYELVCVDDGSCDGSGKILEEYAQRHPGVIRVVRQENAGAPMARNRGMDEAKGEVITFCDADDYVVDGAYRFLLDIYWSGDVDVVKFQSVTMDRYMQKEWKEPEMLSGDVLYDGDGHGFYNRKMQYFVWSNLYRRSFLEKHGIRFKDMMLGEDTMFCLDVFMGNPRTKEVSTNVYRYAVVEGSLTKTRNVAAMKRIVDSYMMLFDALNHYADMYADVASRLLLYKEEQMKPCMSRALSANYSMEEYDEMKRKLQALNVYPLARIGKVAKGINLLLSSYCVYCISGMMYRKVFVPYVLGRIRKN